jgi:peptidoglycan hydrolase-like protein with peptidoglycan-binding domain
MWKQLGGALALTLFAAGCSMHGGGPSASAGSTAHAETGAEALAVNKNAVRHIQTALQSKGFYNGPIDGIVGPRTRTALANYQQSQGLPRTAVLDQQTLQSLTAATTAANNPSQTSGSGSSSPPGRMSADQIRDQLQAQGYDNVSDLRPWGNADYTATADKNGQRYMLEIDGRTGQIFSAQ